jgi:hypothetical protein
MGGRLCVALAGAGHDVRAFALTDVDISSLPADGDVTDKESLVAAFHRRDAVFHATAVVQAWLPDPSVFHSARWLFVNCLHSSTQHKICVFPMHVITSYAELFLVLHMTRSLQVYLCSIIRIWECASGKVTLFMRTISSCLLGPINSFIV